MTMTVKRPGQTDAGDDISIGTSVEYMGHVPGGMVRVRLNDGRVVVMHPACFDELR